VFPGWSSFAAALLETVAVAVHFQDVHVMSEPVEQGTGEAFGAEHLGPFLEGQVRGDHGRASLIALAEHLEEPTASSTCGKWQIFWASHRSLSIV
jgi:hypothetical protein